MIKCTRVTISVDGTTTATQVNLPAFTTRAAYDSVQRPADKCVMDELHVLGHDDAILIELAGEKPWTYTKHIFTRAPT